MKKLQSIHQLGLIGYLACTDQNLDYEIIASLFGFVEEVVGEQGFLWFLCELTWNANGKLIWLQRPGASRCHEAFWVTFMTWRMGMLRRASILRYLTVI